MRELFEAAKENKPAYLSVAPQMMPEDQVLDWMYASKSVDQLSEKLLKHFEVNPHVSITTIDLRYCFDIKFDVGA